MDKGSNPYTNTINEDVYDLYGNPTKVFSNGYQPNNIGGVELDKYKDNSQTNKIPSTTTVGWRTDGVKQQVWTTGLKNYLWYGPENRYVEARYDEVDKEWKVLL